MSKMRDQITADMLAALDWAKAHPVIVCMGLSLVAVFTIGYWAGAS